MNTPTPASILVTVDTLAADIVASREAVGDVAFGFPIAVGLEAVGEEGVVGVGADAGCSPVISSEERSVTGSDSASDGAAVIGSEGSSLETSSAATIILLDVLVENIISGDATNMQNSSAV